MGTLEVPEKNQVSDHPHPQTVQRKGDGQIGKRKHYIWRWRFLLGQQGGLVIFCAA